MNVKKHITKLSGVSKSNIRVMAKSPWSNDYMILRFTAELESASLTEVLSMTLNISNRTINDEHDDSEFEYEFEKELFQEELKEILYDKYKLKMLSIDLEDFEVEYNFV